MAKKYYAVKVGLSTGIFETWEECEASVKGYPGALYKSFKSKSEAYEYMGWDGQQLSFFDTDNIKLSCKSFAHNGNYNKGSFIGQY